MDTFGWILSGGVLMSAIALIGSVTLLLPEAVLNRIIMPLVAFAAGSLLGGAFLHMLPAAIEDAAGAPGVFLWTLAGFALFFALEQFLHWHHCHRAHTDCKQPLTYLILLGDGLHNFLGGVGVAGVFLIDVRLGIAAWLAAAAHEVPQELGDFGVLIHGGWKRKTALALNLLSGSGRFCIELGERSLLQGMVAPRSCVDPLSHDCATARAGAADRHRGSRRRT